jgi:hypothetical protein
MEPNIEAVFVQWLGLTENEKRDFIKELFYFNNLADAEKNTIKKKYLKK